MINYAHIHLTDALCGIAFLVFGFVLAVVMTCASGNPFDHSWVKDDIDSE